VRELDENGNDLGNPNRTGSSGIAGSTELSTSLESSSEEEPQRHNTAAPVNWLADNFSTVDRLEVRLISEKGYELASGTVSDPSLIRRMAACLRGLQTTNLSDDELVKMRGEMERSERVQILFSGGDAQYSSSPMTVFQGIFPEDEIYSTGVLWQGGYFQGDTSALATLWTLLAG